MARAMAVPRASLFVRADKIAHYSSSVGISTARLTRIIVSPADAE
jgi:hypothetical protein